MREMMLISRNPVIQKKVAALFLLKLKEIHKVSQTALLGIVDDINELVQHRIQSIEIEVMLYLSSNGVSQDICNELQKIFRAGQSISFLNTTYLQQKYYKEYLGLLEPVERNVGQKLIKKNKKSKPYIKIVHDRVYEVPLLQSLKQLLANPTIFEEVMRCHKRNDGLLADYCDGSDFKQHQLFSIYPQSLQLNIYYDDVEICNPLGSKSKIHKLGFFYYVLGNLSPKLRSSLKAIQLLAVAKCSVISKYGSNSILQSFMEDIRVLETDGITIVNNDNNYHFNGTITLCSGDNLASHYLGGFKSPSGALRKCRLCLGNDQDKICC